MASSAVDRMAHYFDKMLDWLEEDEIRRLIDIAQRRLPTTPKAPPRVCEELKADFISMVQIHHQKNHWDIPSYEFSGVQGRWGCTVRFGRGQRLTIHADRVFDTKKEAKQAAAGAVYLLMTEEKDQGGDTLAEGHEDDKENAMPDDTKMETDTELAVMV